VGPGPEVVGRWGGDNIEVRATEAALEAQLRCLTMRTGPLVRSDTSGFELEGVVSEARLQHVVGTPIRLRGHVTGDTLFLESAIRHVGSEEWSPFTPHVVTRGSQAVYTGSCLV